MPAVAMRSLARLVILALLPAVAAAGQAPPPKYVPLTAAAMRLQAWTTAVRAHKAGAVDEPARTIAGWPLDDVSSVLALATDRLQQLQVSRDVAADLELKDLTGALMRGLSLHTDIAIAERDTTAPRGKPGAVILVDGQPTRVVSRSAHWPIARRISAALAPLPGQRARVAGWYRATSALMQQWGDIDQLGPHLETGQALFLDDAPLALYQGTLRQTLGDPRLQEWLVQQRGLAERMGRAPAASHEGPLPASASDLPKATRVELGIAEREFRRALTLDATLYEARIRLAHVLATLGDHGQAVDVVRPALEAPLSRYLEFYGALVLGRSAEHLGRFDEAGVAYTRAAARYPGAESASIGLSRVALAQGRSPDGLKLLVDAVGPFSSEQPDPWLEYLKFHDPDAKTLLDAWRADLK